MEQEQMNGTHYEEAVVEDQFICSCLMISLSAEPHSFSYNSSLYL